MTEIAIDGDIINITTKAKSAYATYEVGLKYVDNNPALGLNPKVTIEPTEAAISIIGLAHSEAALNVMLSAGGNFAGFGSFILSDNFEIGDVVEVYKIPNIVNVGGSTSAFLTDSSGHVQIDTTEERKLIVVKKAFSGTTNDWFTYRV